ncbi:SRPBCC domain-containing protein [Alkalicoccobacillus porphyridii]|uniref:PDZ domain-containing protein n=1 Tax=Alkalicoccobacillus porphyridii TaxID=2597270 RepID=A0A554A225_9BACI|nr:SRPBCC domain-containing protein [Alkalicoccobacillus porphyridii]TSB47725.1 PDZ domain-containing protein [Alkalicoccobacillus porphyridii]
MNRHVKASKDIFIKADASRIWRALTIPEERNRWETRACTIDLRIGGELYLDYGWNVTYKGTFTELIENEKIVSVENKGHSTTWLITPVEGGCNVNIEYTGDWFGDLGLSLMENMLFGTYQFLLNFKKVLEENVDIRDAFWKSWLGLMNRTENHRVKVVKTIPNTPAYGVIQSGDYILQVNNEKVSNYDAAELAVSHLEVDRDVTLLVKRENQEFEVTLRTIPFGTESSA